MNEQFYELPEEKQQRIINAGVEVFAKSDYRHAVTDEIARKAGISKGLLFYYFHNKKSLYLYLYEYCAKLIVDQIMDERFLEITDFFELLDYAAVRKLKVLEKTPYLLDFIMRCFYSGEKEIEREMSLSAVGATSQAFQEYFRNVDCTKFREDVLPREIYDMLYWMTDGYVRDRLKKGRGIRADEIMKAYSRWEWLMKQIAYKEEYREEMRCPDPASRTAVTDHG